MGTMAQADKRSATRFKILFSVIGLLAIACNYILNTDLSAFMRHADIGWQVTGLVFHLVSIGWMWLADKLFVGTEKMHWGVAWLLFLALALTSSTGFNFDYFNIQ